MKIALVGLPFCGKTTIFTALTSIAPKEEDGSYQLKAHIGTINVPDGRLDNLARIFQSQKKTYVEISFIDLPRKKEPKEKYLDISSIKQADALVFVIRFFENENVPHIKEKIDPLADYNDLNTEFILLDLEVIQNILKKLDKELSGKKREESIEYNTLKNCVKSLEEEIPLRDLQLSKDQHKMLAGYQLLTIKPLVLIANIAEEQIGKNLSGKLLQSAEGKNLQIFEFCGKIEAEISQINESEREPFLKELGIEKPAREKAIETIYKALDLITFFTVVGKEARAWSIPKNTKAIDAAGKVHTDMQRGFIRAEVVNYKDFIECGSMQEARQKGKVKQEGKDYIVQDADIINFKFNV